MAMVTNPDRILEDIDHRPPPIALPEMQIMLKIIQGIGWINLLIGMPSVFLMITLRSPSLVATGLLSLLIYWLLRMVVRHIKQTQSWTEVGVLAMCGIYFPMFIMWLCADNLLNAILH